MQTNNIIFERRITPNSWKNHLRRSLLLLKSLVLCCNLLLKVVFTKRHHFLLGSHFQLMRWCIQMCMWHLSLCTPHMKLEHFIYYFSLLNNAMIQFIFYRSFLSWNEAKHNESKQWRIFMLCIWWWMLFFVDVYFAVFFLFICPLNFECLR